MLTAGALVILAVSVGGYLMGHAGAADETDARQATDVAYQSAFATTRAASEASAERKGRSEGLTVGERSGSASGNRHGSAKGSAEADSELAVQTEVTPTVSPCDGPGGSCPGSFNYGTLPPGYVPYPSTQPAPSGQPGVDPGCYSVDGIPCD